MKILIKLFICTSLLFTHYASHAQQGYVGINIQAIRGKVQESDYGAGIGVTLGIATPLEPLAVELNFNPVNRWESNQQCDPAGCFRTEIDSNDLMLGINTRLQKIDDSVAVHLRLGYLHSDMDFSVIETFTSTKPGGTVKIDDDVNGYYIGLSVPITIDENIRVVGSFTNMQRERLFKGSSRPFTFDQSLIEFSGQFLF